MCGRFTLRAPIPALIRLLQFAPPNTELKPRYNIAPTQQVAAVRQSKDHPLRELVTLRWGLVPSWADDPKIGSRMINARLDGVATKPAFRSAFRQRRCLVLADGFYEWQGKKVKQAYHIHLPDNEPFAFAGLWETWHGPDGRILETCTIITTEANEIMRSLHERMPVILDPVLYAIWLDTSTPLEKVQAAAHDKSPNDHLQTTPVDKWVNDVKHDDPRCLEPANLLF